MLESLQIARNKRSTYATSNLMNTRRFRGSPTSRGRDLCKFRTSNSADCKVRCDSAPFHVLPCSLSVVQIARTIFQKDVCMGKGLG